MVDVVWWLVCRLTSCVYESMDLQILIRRNPLIKDGCFSLVPDSNEEASISTVAKETDEIEAFNQVSIK